ncbi:hypothetical protein SAMN04489733_1202 [Amycolatopsis keratiniphila]|nr:hypothetical protein SAMN04489733_1202 [Amycolatopsis keratiniphila]
MSRHALRIVTPTRSHLVRLLHSWTQEPRVLHIGAAGEDMKAALANAGFLVTVATNVDDLDITLPAGTYFDSILLSSEALTGRESLRSQILLLRKAAEHVTANGVVLVEVRPATSPAPIEPRHGAHIHIADELDLIAEMAGLRRVRRSQLIDDSHEEILASLYRRKP